MSSKRVLAAVVALAALAGAVSTRASLAETAVTKPADDAKPAVEKKKFSKAEFEAFLTKCSVEADEKGLTKAKNKLAERKAFRRQCMSKFGVEPKA